MIEVSARVGAAAVQRVRTVPVAVDPLGRWMFLVASGTAVDPDLRVSHDTVLHGPGSWIPAPPTRTPAGRIRWEVHPAEVGWRMPDARVLQQVLAAPAHLPEPMGARQALAPEVFARTSRELRTAA